MATTTITIKYDRSTTNWIERDGTIAATAALIDDAEALGDAMTEAIRERYGQLPDALIQCVDPNGSDLGDIPHDPHEGGRLVVMFRVFKGEITAMA